MPKTLFCVIVLFCIFLFASCSKTDAPKVPDLSGDISLSGSIECPGVSASADITRTDGVWSVTFTAPDSVKGMIITENGGEYNVAYSGITFNYKQEEVPFLTAVQYLTGSIEAVAQKNDISVKSVKDGVQISGTLLQSGYIMNADSSGNIQSVSAGGYTFNFGNTEKPDESSGQSGTSSSAAEEGDRQTAAQQTMMK